MWQVYYGFLNWYFHYLVALVSPLHHVTLVTHHVTQLSLAICHLLYVDMVVFQNQTKNESLILWVIIMSHTLIDSTEDWIEDLSFLPSPSSVSIASSSRFCDSAFSENITGKLFENPFSVRYDYSPESMDKDLKNVAYRAVRWPPPVKRWFLVHGILNKSLLLYP